MAALTAPKSTARYTYNFSAGPAVLPRDVLTRIQREIVELPGVGSSVLEISHRSKEFIAIADSARTRLRRVLAIPDSHEILFLQGGSRLQFSMIPMNLMTPERSVADYAVTGSWGKKSYGEAKLFGEAKLVWDGGETNYDRVPAGPIQSSSNAAYLHITSNETIQGVQFAEPPECQTPIVCDMSSDILSRPCNVDDYGLIYACAQKNAGIAGLTVVIIDKRLISSRDDIPGYLCYKNHADADSMYNTPPTFGIYVLNLLLDWIESEFGDLTALQSRNESKSALLYRVIDEFPELYIGHARTECRSRMNVTFRVPSDELQSELLAICQENQLEGLKGHRSVGGLRASIYNAMPIEGVEKLEKLMRQFAAKHG